MKKVLLILPHSIAGRIIIENSINGFIKNGFEVLIYDELKEKNFKFDKSPVFNYIFGYDFSPVKFKIDNKIKAPAIAYFADIIYSPQAEPYYKEYFKYLKNKDIYTFYWDRTLSKEENHTWQPLFVDCEIYKDYSKPKSDILFMGRLDTEIRLKTYLKLNKILKEYSFEWYAIEKHYLDALERSNDDEKEILKKTYRGFLDNSKDIVKAINNSKIVYNINSQGKSSINLRTFETTACKRLLISDKREELDLFDNIIPIYSNISDLAQKIDYYLKNQNEYEKITSKCQKIIKSNYDTTFAIANMLKISDCGTIKI